MDKIIQTSINQINPVLNNLITHKLYHVCQGTKKLFIFAFFFLYVKIKKTQIKLSLTKQSFRNDPFFEIGKEGEKKEEERERERQTERAPLL